MAGCSDPMLLKCQVTHIIDPDNFYCHLGDDVSFREFEAYEKELTNVGERHNNRSFMKGKADLAIGQTVLAKPQGSLTWVRGKVTFTAPTKKGWDISLHFIDSGKGATVPSYNVIDPAALEPGFIDRWPEQAQFCRLQHVTPRNGRWDRDAQKLFAALSRGRLRARVTGAVDGGQQLLLDILHGEERKRVAEIFREKGYVDAVANDETFGGLGLSGGGGAQAVIGDMPMDDIFQVQHKYPAKSGPQEPEETFALDLLSRMDSASSDTSSSLPLDCGQPGAVAESIEMSLWESETVGTVVAKKGRGHPARAGEADGRAPKRGLGRGNLLTSGASSDAAPVVGGERELSQSPAQTFGPELGAAESDGSAEEIFVDQVKQVLMDLGSLGEDGEAIWMKISDSWTFLFDTDWTTLDRASRFHLFFCQLLARSIPREDLSLCAVLEVLELMDMDGTDVPCESLMVPLEQVFTAVPQSGSPSQVNWELERANTLLAMLHKRESSWLPRSRLERLGTVLKAKEASNVPETSDTVTPRVSPVRSVADSTTRSDSKSATETQRSPPGGLSMQEWIEARIKSSNPVESSNVVPSLPTGVTTLPSNAQSGSTFEPHVPSIPSNNLTSDSFVSSSQPSAFLLANNSAKTAVSPNEQLSTILSSNSQSALSAQPTVAMSSFGQQPTVALSSREQSTVLSPHHQMSPFVSQPAAQTVSQATCNDCTVSSSDDGFSYVRAMLAALNLSDLLPKFQNSQIRDRTLACGPELVKELLSESGVPLGNSVEIRHYVAQHPVGSFTPPASSGTAVPSSSTVFGTPPGSIASTPLHPQLPFSSQPLLPPSSFVSQSAELGKNFQPARTPANVVVEASVPLASSVTTAPAVSSTRTFAGTEDQPISLPPSLTRVPPPGFSGTVAQTFTVPTSATTVPANSTGIPGSNTAQDQFTSPRPAVARGISLSSPDRTGGGGRSYSRDELLRVGRSRGSPSKKWGEVNPGGLASQANAPPTEASPSKASPGKTKRGFGRGRGKVGSRTVQTACEPALTSSILGTSGGKIPHGFKRAIKNIVSSNLTAEERENLSRPSGPPPVPSEPLPPPPASLPSTELFASGGVTDRPFEIPASWDGTDLGGSSPSKGVVENKRSHRQPAVAPTYPQKKRETEDSNEAKGSKPYVNTQAAEAIAVSDNIAIPDMEYFDEPEAPVLAPAKPLRTLFPSDWEPVKTPSRVSSTQIVPIATASSSRESAGARESPARRGRGKPRGKRKARMQVGGLRQNVQSGSALPKHLDNSRPASTPPGKTRASPSPVLQQRSSTPEGIQSGQPRRAVSHSVQAVFGNPPGLPHLPPGFDRGDGKVAEQKVASPQRGFAHSQPGGGTQASPQTTARSLPQVVDLTLEDSPSYRDADDDDGASDSDGVDVEEEYSDEDVGGKGGGAKPSPSVPYRQPAKKITFTSFTKSSTPPRFSR